MLMQQRAVALVALAAVIAGCGKAAVTARPMAASALAAQEAPMEGLDGDDKITFHRGTPMPVPPGRTGRWLLVSNHNHSTYWDGEKPLPLMQSEAYLAQFDAMVLTDHNTMRGCESPEFKAPPHGLIMVRGMEWGAFRENGDDVVGHAGLLGMSGIDGPPTSAGLDGMLGEATARNATVIINHPFCWHNTWAQPKPDPRAHAVEVWNGWWYRVNPIMHNDLALGWWQDALKEGRHLAAVSGTDNHGDNLGNIARNANLVYAETPDEAGILAGLRAGRVSITSSPTAGRLFLEADADGDGVFETIMGESLPHAGKVAVRARVLGGAGKSVCFYTAKGRVAIAAVKSNDATIPLTAELTAPHDFVRAELRAHPHLAFSMTAVSNPIYGPAAP